MCNTFRHLKDTETCTTTPTCCSGLLSKHSYTACTAASDVCCPCQPRLRSECITSVAFHDCPHAQQVSQMARLGSSHPQVLQASKAHLKQADRQAAEVMQRPRALERALEPLVFTTVTFPSVLQRKQQVQLVELTTTWTILIFHAGWHLCSKLLSGGLTQATPSQCAGTHCSQNETRQSDCQIV